MRILLVGDITSPIDEGLKKIAYSLYSHLATRHQVRCMAPRDLVRYQNRKEVRAFRPDIIHYVPGPSIRSFLLLAITKHLIGRSVKSVLSATRPDVARWQKSILQRFKPDLALTQSTAFEGTLNGLGISTTFLPNGVDRQLFHPVTEPEKSKLRIQLGWPSDKIIVLHVGHLRKSRQLDSFIRLQKNAKFQCVIVGSTSTKKERTIVNSLRQAGCLVMEQYIDNIALLYQAADVYLFTLSDPDVDAPMMWKNRKGAVDMPLSVLEAQACGLPVITTKFGALPRFFKSATSIQFSPEPARQLEMAVGSLNTPVAESIVPDWQGITLQLEQLYEKLTRP
jgi:glycosyltransferase involved in cell wall biosynthesis